MQTGVTVDNTTNAIAGTLKYLDDENSDIVKVWGEGNFIALKFDIDPTADSVKVGMRPTYKSGSPVDDDSGLVEIKNDPDKNGVFKVTDVTGNTPQKFRIVSTKGNQTKAQEFSLSGLTLQSE